MKAKRWVVEHIEYNGDQRGLPSQELNDSTFIRRNFQTETEARKYIDTFIESDPSYVEMWVAHIKLISIKETTEVFYP